MKIRLLITLLVCFGVCACTPTHTKKTGEVAKEHALVGTWEFVSGRYTPSGKPPIVVKSPDLRALKIITPTHFSYVTEKGDGSFYVAGAGSCKVEPHQYTETLNYASVANMKNKSYTFSYRVENDVWYIEGKEDDSYTEEVWRKIP